jgi:hypothetical protein
LARRASDGIAKIHEPLLIQTTIPEATIEALNERVLGRFARLNEVQIHAGLSAPEEHRFARHLRNVVED